MQFIIMDLEWNNAFCPETRKGMNEIIEFGAVRLDEQLRETGSFSQLVRSVLGKKLHARVSALTHITNEDLKSGVPFAQSIRAFSDWVGEEPAVFLSWSNTDLYVLMENLLYFTKETKLPFLKQYADLQRFCQMQMKSEGHNQVSLLHAAQQMGIPVDEASLHRALDDCRLSAQCLRKTYDEARLKPFIVDCDERFYGVLSFHPYYITDFSDPALDKTKFHCSCDRCNRHMKRISKWEMKGGSFRAVFQCGRCSRKSRLVVRAKQYYDRVDTKIRTLEVKERSHAGPPRVSERAQG